MTNSSRAAIFIITIMMFGGITVVKSIKCYLCDQDDHPECTLNAPDTSSIPYGLCEVNAKDADKWFAICGKTTNYVIRDGNVVAVTSRHCEKQRKGLVSKYCSRLQCGCDGNYCNGAMPNKAPRVLLVLGVFSALAAYLYK